MADDFPPVSPLPHEPIDENPSEYGLYSAAIERFLEGSQEIRFDPSDIPDNNPLTSRKGVEIAPDGGIVGGLMLTEDDPEFIAYIAEFSELYEKYNDKTLPDDQYYAEVAPSTSNTEFNRMIGHVKEVTKKVEDLIDDLSRNQLPKLSMIIYEDNPEIPEIAHRRVAELLMELKYKVEKAVHYPVARIHFSREMLTLLSTSRLHLDLITNDKTNKYWDLVYYGLKDTGLISEEQYEQAKSKINDVKIDENE